LETQSAVSRGIQRTMFPVQVRETGDAQFMTEKNVEVELHLFFSSHQHPKLCCEAKQSLSDFGASYGPTTGASKPDYITFAKKKIRKHKLALMCIELKDTFSSRCARRSLSKQHHVGKDGRRRHCQDNRLGRRYVCRSAIHQRDGDEDEIGGQVRVIGRERGLNQEQRLERLPLGRS
jgi:hypothetical protein